MAILVSILQILVLSEDGKKDTKKELKHDQGMQSNFSNLDFQ